MTLTAMLNLVNRKVRFFDAKKTIADEKISLNVGRRVAIPACIAGVLISDPNFSPRDASRSCNGSEANREDLRDVPSIASGKSSA